MEPNYLGLRTSTTLHQYPSIDKYMVKEIFLRCGKYLRKIDFDCIDFKCMSLVAKHCKNIQSIVGYGDAINDLINLMT